MTEKLKPCPFCGQEPIVWEHHDIMAWNVECWNPETGCVLKIFGATREEAINRWNTRAK